MVCDADAGKTFVMRSLADLFILVGKIKNLQGMGQFPFRNLVNNKIVFLDELQIPICFYDDFKEIFAGQSMLINVKHKVAISSHSSPVIICSNNDDIVDMTNDVWNSLIFQFRVKSYRSQLTAEQKTSIHYIYPPAWIQLFSSILGVSF